MGSACRRSKRELTGDIPKEIVATNIVGIRLELGHKDAGRAQRPVSEPFALACKKLELPR